MDVYSVLVATPVRVGFNTALRAKSLELYNRLTFKNKERAVFENCIELPGRGKYAPNAVARNALIDFCLKDYHTHVLWMDADLVDCPPDLIERLLYRSTTYAVAPYVLIEDSNQFYDYGGFVRHGLQFAQFPPYTDAEGIVEMDSVGTCYLVPAWVYENGCRYRPEGDEVEHVSFFRQAEYYGLSVVADSTLIVRHANLPKYGENWH